MWSQVNTRVSSWTQSMLGSQDVSQHFESGIGKFERDLLHARAPMTPQASKRLTDALIKSKDVQAFVAWAVRESKVLEEDGRTPQNAWRYLTKLFCSGADQQAFFGAIRLMRFGVLQRDLPPEDPRTKRHDWVSLIAGNGSEPAEPRSADGTMTISLFDRLAFMQAHGFSLHKVRGKDCPLDAARKLGNQKAIEALEELTSQSAPSMPTYAPGAWPTPQHSTSSSGRDDSSAESHGAGEDARCREQRFDSTLREMMLRLQGHRIGDAQPSSSDPSSSGTGSGRPPSWRPPAANTNALTSDATSGSMRRRPSSRELSGHEPSSRTSSKHERADWNQMSLDDQMKWLWA